MLGWENGRVGCESSLMRDSQVQPVLSLGPMQLVQSAMIRLGICCANSAARTSLQHINLDGVVSRT